MGNLREIKSINEENLDIDVKYLLIISINLEIHLLILELVDISSPLFLINSSTFRHKKYFILL